jgi:hypothetical protein
MPYGMPKDVGGDSKQNTRKMEHMVGKIMKRSGKDKESAIKIAKANLVAKKRKGKHA